MAAKGHVPDLDRWLAGLTLGGILAGALAWLAGSPILAEALWAITAAVLLAPLTLDVWRELRRGEPGVDVIALLAIGGSLAFGQYLAGAVVALMLAGGQALESFAAARARRELSALLARSPRVVHRYEDGRLTSPPLDAVRPGDLLLVKPGEIVPVDGLVEGGIAVLDESALTGESRPVERVEGATARSGTVNAAGPLRLRAVATAAESTYAGIVRLVRAAESSKAPFVRMADRYALVFLPLTLVVAGVAWALSGDPVRAVAVVVVATPCPLILAAPIALIAGMSRAAHRGILVKGGSALEALARARILLLDKTGTITTGVPALQAVEVFGAVAPDELLRLAASLDQVSPHVFASALTRAARERGLPLSFPDNVAERLGHGIQGTVDGRRVALGKLVWIAGGIGQPGALPAGAQDVRRRAALAGSSSVFVAVDGELAGALLLYDSIRPDAGATLRTLRQAGLDRVVLVTGDRPEVAESVGAAIGADLILAERSPADL